MTVFFWILKALLVVASPFIIWAGVWLISRAWHSGKFQELARFTRFTNKRSSRP